MNIENFCKKCKIKLGKATAISEAKQELFSITHQLENL